MKNQSARSLFPSASSETQPSALRRFPGLAWVADDQLKVAEADCFQDHADAQHPAIAIGTHVGELLSPCPDNWLGLHERAREGERVSLQFAYRGRRYQAVLQPCAVGAEAVAGVSAFALPLPDNQGAELERLGRVAGRMAHDLNNIVTIILSYTQFILDDVDNSSPLHEDASVVMDAGKRISALVAHLLSFGGRVTPLLRKVNLCTLVQERVAPFAENAEPAVIVVAEYPPAPVFISADPLHLARAMDALLQNAVDAVGVEGRIEVRVCRSGEGAQARAELTILDTGVGLSAEAQAHLFEPFFSSKTKAAGQMRGLGLASAYGTVRQCGGRLTLAAMQPRGTRCELVFPLIGQDEGAAVTLG